jgi:ribosomal protein S18 acetylase RimI-like enzyme
MAITPVRDSAEIETVARLAHEIWNEHYVPIIGLAQVQYMVPKFQSAAAVAAQIADGLEYFLIGRAGAPVGYFAFERQPATRSLFLSKLYVRKDMRGHGLARQALSHLDSVCRSASLTTIWLTVNKRNPAIGTYERLGFKTVAAVVADIGGGFVMDDYRMERTVTA